MRLVFVHGALVRDGAWWWSRMVPLLDELGIPSQAVELPSCDPAVFGDLHADAAAVTSALDESSEPVLLCGHSYGGMVISEAADGHPRVQRLIYLDSYLPEIGESLADLTGPGPGPVEPVGDGTVRLKPELAPLFVHDCDEAAVEGAMLRLTRQSGVVFAQASSGAAWRKVPSTYVVCADDRATPPDLQRTQAKRAGKVVELPTGHHPFLSHPELLARTIATAAG